MALSIGIFKSWQGHNDFIINSAIEGVFILLNKVEICGVNTSKLPVLSNEVMRELFVKMQALFFFFSAELRNFHELGADILIALLPMRQETVGAVLNAVFQIGIVTPTVFP